MQVKCVTSITRIIHFLDNKDSSNGNLFHHDWSVIMKTYSSRTMRKVNWAQNTKFVICGDTLMKR